MDLRHLHYFVTIAEEGSFTRAADRLWVAQPGLSAQIRRLEAELGIRLFERRARGVDLTGAGELFLERARAALAAADAARAVGADIEAGTVGRVRVGISTEARSRTARDLLAGFVRERPDVELTTFECYAGTLVRELTDGRLDAVLAPSECGSAELFRERLGREPWCVLAGRSHRLAGGSGPVASHELAGEPLVLTDHRDGAAYDRAVTELLKDLGVAPAHRRGGPGTALFADVAAGEAIGLTTSPVLAGGLAARPLEPARQLEFSLLWRDETPAPALSRLIEAAAAVAEPARPVLQAVA